MKIIITSVLELEGTPEELADKYVNKAWDLPADEYMELQGTGTDEELDRFSKIFDGILERIDYDSSIGRMAGFSPK